MSLNLDELVSAESDTAVNSETEILNAPLSPPAPNIPEYLPVGLTVGQTSPSSRSLSSELSSLSRSQSHVVNAVHMHVQENAKVPTFNRSIDRSNAGRPSTITSSLKKKETLNREPGSFSMELFLSEESSHRRSIEQNYETLGSLFSDVGLDNNRRASAEGKAKSDSKLVATDDSQMEIDALPADIDPTPWSEIERKIHDDEEKVQGTTVNTAPPPVGRPHQYNYYRYGRHHQLPIPGKPSSLNQSSSTTNKKNSATNTGAVTMAQAIATAAVIASTQTATPRPAHSPPPVPIESSMRPPPPYTKAQQTTPLRSTQSSGSGHYQRAAYSAPQHSVTHTPSRASVLAAANKKSQYGFGGNHTVPSVPAPPPMANGKFKVGNGKVPSLPIIPSLPSGEILPPNSGAAYERKKQRAKDARIKLNDAIERLSIAMNFAGTQSKQRNQFLSTRISATKDRPKTLEITEECAKIAEQAKKWDRPSFVGTAASIVQELNSQCECLMSELVTLQERLDSASNTHIAHDRLTLHPEHKRHEHPVSPLNGRSSHGPKRIRSSLGREKVNVGLSGEVHHVDATSNERTIFGSVKEFLDPISMARCSCVSRRWRDMGAFDDDGVWLHLAVKRFGFYNVRQWTERLEDARDDTLKKYTKKSLYRAMNLANVMPHFKQDNVRLMGDAKIPGRVSGWVFMVERSNGETLRSVKTEPGTQASENGSYQSRAVVELRIIIQNTGMASSQPVIIRNQNISVDISTRRTGGELKEIDWDERFSKVVKRLDDTILDAPAEQSRFDIGRDLCHLKLFESVMLDIYIYARGCSTTSKFQQRCNFTKLLVCLDGTTVPMVIPFLRDVTHGNN